ncbi:MAG: TonB-dependent receptor [Cellvibrio sp.]|uniref:TonB-dependent receptor plug domain-containing protein n=1 Tax=Cellvibrio sp. TaxID=1965322 RepID=UPI0031AA5A4A
MLHKNVLAAVAAASCTLGGTLVPVWAYAQDGAAVKEVVVTASLTARDSATSPAFTSVVSADDIAKAPVNSLPDLLRETVGVTNQTDSTGRDQIQIRGMGGRYTLILVNGKRVSSSGALWRGGDFDFSSIPLGSIERVEIVRGPMAALYGSDAMGGVVNIITKKPTEDWVGAVTAEYRGIDAGEDGDQKRVSASATGAVSDAVGLSVSGEFTDRDAWFRNSAADPKEVPGLEEKKTASLVTTTSFKISDTQSLDLDVTYMNDERPKGLYSYAYYPAWDFESFSYREQEITRYTYGFTHKAEWDGFNTVAFIQQENSKIDDFNSSYNDPQQRRVEEKNTYAKVYATGELGRHALTAGIDLRNQVIEDAVSYLDTGKVETNDVALFAQDEIAITDKLNFTLGGRLDDHEVFGDHFSPKAYATYKLADDVVLKGGVSEAFKAPDAYQMSEEYRVISCGGSCYLSGNPDLKPESSTNYEIGIEVNKNTWNLSVVIFDNDVDDMIIAVYDPAGPSRRWENIAKAKTTGVELDAGVDLSSNFSLSANITALDTEYINEAGVKTELESRPESLGNLSLNWQVSDSFTTGLGAHYTGKQIYEGNDLPSYTRLDWTAAYDVTSSTVIRFGVKNLTDVDLTEESENFISQELGRNYYLSATYNF